MGDIEYLLKEPDIELFLQRARRFKARTNDYPAILRICRLINGMPLGIELAAVWVGSLTCDEIADEIERGGKHENDQKTVYLHSACLPFSSYEERSRVWISHIYIHGIAPFLFHAGAGKNPSAERIPSRASTTITTNNVPNKMLSHLFSG